MKSKTLIDHLEDLKENFTTLKRHNMKLNPNKCVLGVESDKILGFLVDCRRIEANLGKIQAALDMTSLTCINEVQQLTGYLATLDRFLSKLGDKYHYFFDTIRKKITFELSGEAKATFLRLKEHLHTLPSLMSPLVGEVLYMYLSISEYVFSVVLLAQ